MSNDSDSVDVVKDEQGYVWAYEKKREPVSVCSCVLPHVPSDEIIVSPRKQLILSTVSRTEEYLRTRRIPELIRYLLTKVIADGSSHPIAYLESLLDDCMLFRAGLGQAPVLYEERHLEAVVKSFDPGNRGWLSSGQLRRLYATLGLSPVKSTDDRIPTNVVLSDLRQNQELELLKLLSAGIETEETSNTESVPSGNSGSKITIP